MPLKIFNPITRPSNITMPVLKAFMIPFDCLVTGFRGANNCFVEEVIVL